MNEVRRVLSSSAFWVPFLAMMIVTGAFFAWELGYLHSILPSFPRPAAYVWELAFTGALALLLSLNAGLAVWQSKHGACPAGVKRASGAAALLGAFTLICPACILLPASLIGIGYLFVFLGPYLPLLRVIAVALLVIATWMLRPRRN